MPGRKRNRLPSQPPKWAVVRGMLHMRIKDAAAELKVPLSYLQRLCHQNGYPSWPGKRIRYMIAAGLSGPSQLAKIAATKQKEDYMIGIQAPVANHPPAPGEEVTTLNLIDKVGLSSSS